LGTVGELTAEPGLVRVKGGQDVVLDAEDDEDPHEGTDTDTFLAPFEAGNDGPGHAGTLRELLLREQVQLPPGHDVVTESTQSVLGNRVRLVPFNSIHVLHNSRTSTYGKVALSYLRVSLHLIMSECSTADSPDVRPQNPVAQHSWVSVAELGQR
jgi:hypothetical protein